MGKPREKEPTIDEKYSLPKLQEVTCPHCKKGIIKVNRTLHTLPDKEEILIMLLECESCKFSRSDVIPLSSAFQPGIYTIHVTGGDLTAKIFRSPTGVILLPEADFEIEPGRSAEYLITNIEGILNRMIQWSKFMLKDFKEQENQYQKIQKTLEILTRCRNGTMDFTIILVDKEGGSYIIPSNESLLSFEAIRFEEE
ncbi:MAG: ZPR1 zinc finger domain-containing protein [Promethearchaeota archaeon]|nr:MAG: ZPR1 zinc finger domain-containing protein [Candidatus Lokiarchaeota archaeon]